MQSCTVVNVDWGTSTKVPDLVSFIHEWFFSLLKFPNHLGLKNWDHEYFSEGFFPPKPEIWAKVVAKCGALPTSWSLKLNFFIRWDLENKIMEICLSEVWLGFFRLNLEFPQLRALIPFSIITFYISDFCSSENIILCIMFIVSFTMVWIWTISLWVGMIFQ